MGDIEYIYLPERIRPSAIKELAWKVFQYQYFEGILIHCPSYQIPYVGAGLSLMLKNFHRPIILYHEEGQRTQGENWVRNSCPGVYVLEDEVLYLACRTAFSPKSGITSPYHPPVGLVSDNFYCIYQDRVPRIPEEEPMVCDAISENIGLVRPGFAFAPEETLFEKDAYFVLLHGPEDRTWLFDQQKTVLERLRKQEIPVVVHGFPPQIEEPQLRRQILRSGVILTGDMTQEAALMKLMWTMARCSAPESVRLYFSLSFGGEVTQLRKFQF